MDFATYQRQSARTRNNNLHPEAQRASHALGLAGEAGELANEIKKVLFHGHTPSPDKIAEEIGDCLWYLAQIATDNGIDLASILDQNVAKLRARYPDGYSDDRSRDRE